MHTSGFTLVELLIVVAIIAVLALLAFVGTTRFIERGRKVSALAQFRDFHVGMSLFQSDYQKPPTPQSKRDNGWDTIYSDPGGFYKNSFLVSVLAGDDKDFPYGGDNFSTIGVNPRQESYMVFPYAPEKKNGVGSDGVLYDPWGRAVIVAVNGFSAPNTEIREFSNGQNDRRLHTWGLGEYRETKPREEAWVFWSYGKDGMKGKKQNATSPKPWDVVPLSGSDDVISW